MKKSSIGRNNRGYENGSLAEREVAKNSDWTPESILERGVTLLRFFEDRWGVSFCEKDDNESDESYLARRDKSMCDLLSLGFVADGRATPNQIEIIPIDEVEIYSDEGTRIELNAVSNNYFANLYYFKIQKGLKNRGIPFKAVRPNRGYVGLRKELENGNFSLFANVWFQKGSLRIDTNRPSNGGIGDYKGENYSSNFKYTLKVDESTDIGIVVDELAESYTQESVFNEVGLEKVISTINQMLQDAMMSGSDFVEVSALDIQNKLRLKRAAGIICDALNYLKNENDVIVEQAKRKTLSYKIRFDLNARKN